MRELFLRWFIVLAMTFAFGMAAVVRAEETNGVFNLALADNATFTVREGDQEHSYRLAKDATVLINAEIRTLSDLRAGDVVRVTWENRDGQRLASMVTCNRP